MSATRSVHSAQRGSAVDRGLPDWPASRLRVGVEAGKTLRPRVGVGDAVVHAVFIEIKPSKLRALVASRKPR